MITKKDYNKITYLERKKHHKLVRKIHKKHKISYKTLFYMKEYGPKSHVASVIVKESLKILIITSIISSIGGIALQSVEQKIIALTPLLILVPALNNLIGSFGTIVSSKFTTMIYTGKIQSNWWRYHILHRLIIYILLISAIVSVYLGTLSYALAYVGGFAFSYTMFLKIIGISLLASTLLVGVICVVSIVGGLYIYHKKEDPNNFLIPMTTSIADLGSIAVFSLMILWLF